MAYAELMYERLKGCKDLTPIQHRVVLLIHIRKKREKLLEMEALTYGASNDNAMKALQSTYDRYAELLMPGQSKKVDSFEEQAKRQLASEANKVYLVTPHGKGADETLKRALNSSNPELRKWAAWEKHKERVAQARMNTKLQRKKKTPKNMKFTRI